MLHTLLAFTTDFTPPPARPTYEFYNAGRWFLARATDLLRTCGQNYLLFMLVWLFVLRLVVLALIKIKNKNE